MTPPPPLSTLGPSAGGPRMRAGRRNPRRAAIAVASSALACGLAAALAAPVSAAPATPVTASATASASASAPAPAAAAAPESTSPNIEEARLENVVPGASVPTSRQFVESSGLAGAVTELDERLAQATTADVEQIVREAGASLWSLAVAGAQGKNPAATGDRYDDRGLYWARLAERTSLKRWVAEDPARLPRLESLLGTLERSSRGFDDVAHTDDPKTRRILTTGFDPFQLDAVGQRSNPSGSAALVLDGTTIDTPTGPAVVQAVMLPVTWSGFDQGIVEDVYGPGLRYGARSIDMLVTISQGRPGAFDIERFAGVWRGGAADNLNEGTDQGYRQETPAAPGGLGWPQPAPSPQFIETTLPVRAMVDAKTGPAAVRLNERICIAPSALRVSADIQCGATDKTDPRWFAVEGGGGDYLSNESMYRANRLRVEMGRSDVAGGHLHTPSLDYASIPAGAVSSAAFEAARASIVDQTVALFGAAAGALRVPEPTTVTVTPGQVDGGNEVSLVIEKLLPREPVEFRPPGGGAVPLVADDAGRATLTWRVPATLPAGEHPLVIARQDGSRASSSLTVRAAAPTPTPTPTSSPTASATATPTVSPGTSQAPDPGHTSRGAGASAAGDGSHPGAGAQGTSRETSGSLAHAGVDDARPALTIAAIAAALGLLLMLARRRSAALSRR